MIFVKSISIKDKGVRSLKMKKVNVIVVIGSGSIDQAIARRLGTENHILLANIREGISTVAVKTLSDAGYTVSTAGVSPSQALPSTIFQVDLYGTALVLEEFGNVIEKGGSAVVIASQSGLRLTSEQDKALATKPTEELLSLSFLQSDAIDNSLFAYQMSKRGNSLRVKAEAVREGKRGARINTIGSGIIITPIAHEEFNGPRGETYRRILEISPAERAGTPDEIGVIGALSMGRNGTFITGSDFLMDRGVTAVTSMVN